MEGKIRHIAQQLKTDLESEFSGHIKRFLHFAEAYAVNRKLHHEAIILNLNFNSSNEKRGQESIRKQMIHLVDDIVQDYEENASSPAFLEAKRRRAELEAYFLKKEPDNREVFRCEKIKKHYPKSNFQLEGIDLSLRLGEITGVVGENGNGKTTLLRIIVGELLPSSGLLHFPLFEDENWVPVDWGKIKPQIAYVPQELPNWYGSLKDNIKFEAAMHGVKGKKNQEETDFIIQRLGLEEHLNKSWKELSGGFKLRFALAKALVWKPQLLVIDEPLANLDIKTQLAILQDLRHLSKSLSSPMSILLSSQHLHEIEAVADKILFLKQGKPLFYGNGKDIGNSSDVNVFELNCKLKIKALQNILAPLPDASIYYNGLSYVIRTSSEIDSSTVLKLLLDSGVEIDYFRNITNSVKRLFDI